MKQRTSWTSAIVLILAAGSGGRLGAQTAVFSGHPPLPATVTEVSVDTGAWMAGTDIGRDRNVAGGETLIGRLGHGIVIGARIGRYGSFIGVELATWSASAPVEVANESGVRFPNHGKSPVFVTGGTRLYPLGRSLAGGVVRPYVVGAVVAMLVSADLDNVDGQTLRLLPGLQTGAGVKWLLGADQRRFVELRVSLLRMRGVRPFESFTAHTWTVGYGVRQ